MDERQEIEALRRELDEEGHFQIRWGKQLIA